MSLETLFGADGMLCSVSVHSKKKLFQDLAGHFEKSGLLENSGLTARDILTAALEREKLGSTGVGSGVAIPHARLKGITSVRGVFATLEDAVDYEAVDNRPVDLVAMLIAPLEAGGEHLRALAQISRRLRRQDVRARLRAAPDAQSLFISLTDETSISAA